MLVRIILKHIPKEYDACIKTCRGFIRIRKAGVEGNLAGITNLEDNVRMNYCELRNALWFSPLWSVMRVTAVGAIFAKPVAPVGARYFGALHFSISQAKVSLGLLPFAFPPFPFSPTLRLLSNVFFENLLRAVPNRETHFGWE
jgi:hypothetical protein